MGKRVYTIKKLLFTHKVSRYFVVGVRKLRIVAHIGWIPTIAGKNDLIIIYYRQLRVYSICDISIDTIP